MNMFSLSLSYLRRRALTTCLNILLLSFGIATILILLLFSSQLEDNLYKNAEGVDVVVGAKGSPVQLILSGIFHIDSPTGNIDLADARQLMNHPMVASSIPLALGDNVQGYRVVGTTSGYLEKYNADFDEGSLWNHKFEVVLGSAAAEGLNVGVGDLLESSHGFSEEGGAHDEHGLKVAGVLRPTGTVMDRLILSGVETMWGIHSYGNETDENPGEDHEITDESFLNESYSDQQITSLLIKYRSPLAAAQFPRFVNAETLMQAAAPAVEITRLLNLLGVGLDAIRVFAWILILASVLGIFIALFNSMKERKYDLAIMRTLGGSRLKLFTHILLEGLMISLAGAVLGMAMGHLAMEVIGAMFAEAQQFALTGSVFIPGEAWILALAAAVGVFSSIIPATQAYRTDIAETLSKT